MGLPSTSAQQGSRRVRAGRYDAPSQAARPVRQKDTGECGRWWSSSSASVQQKEQKPAALGFAQTEAMPRLVWGHRSVSSAGANIHWFAFWATATAYPVEEANRHTCTRTFAGAYQKEAVRGNVAECQVDNWASVATARQWCLPWSSHDGVGLAGVAVEPALTGLRRDEGQQNSRGLDAQEKSEVCERQRVVVEWKCGALLTEDGRGMGGWRMFIGSNFSRDGPQDQCVELRKYFF